MSYHWVLHKVPFLKTRRDIRIVCYLNFLYGILFQRGTLNPFQLNDLFRYPYIISSYFKERFYFFYDIFCTIYSQKTSENFFWSSLKSDSIKIESLREKRYWKGLYIVKGPCAILWTCVATNFVMKFNVASKNNAENCIKKFAFRGHAPARPKIGSD